MKCRTINSHLNENEGEPIKVGKKIVGHVPRYTLTKCENEAMPGSERCGDCRVYFRDEEIK